MRLKHTFFLPLMMLSGIMTLHATGAGVQAGFFPAAAISEEGFSAGAAELNLTGTMRFTRIPLTFGAGLTAGCLESGTSIGLSSFADYWISDAQIKDNWNIYTGFGALLSLQYDFEDDWSITAGPRFFAGMDWIFIDNYIEFYVQQNVVPALYLPFSTSLPTEKGFLLMFPFEAGVRLHF